MTVANRALSRSNGHRVVGRAAKVLAPLVRVLPLTQTTRPEKRLARAPACADVQRGSRSLRWRPQRGVMVAFCTAPPDGRPCWFNPHLTVSTDDTGGWVFCVTPTPSLANLPASRVDRRQPHHPHHPFFQRGALPAGPSHPSRWFPARHPPLSPRPRSCRRRRAAGTPQRPPPPVQRPPASPAAARW